MANIDERVVSMQFDNKNFEQGARESISTLDRLKQALQLKNGTKGLEDVDKAAQNHKLGKIGEALDTITSKFSATSVVAVTALANIANKAVNVGTQMVKALTIDPIMTGFQEYETQMNAVQTILANTASKGTTLNQVSAALDDLNRYADMTIYNFTEMTRNIGTFTAAGLDLDTSARAIKGIANLAAVSGSNSQQASTAMYQLSQALAAGTVKLMDWNSVVNAGMGGQVFQDALKETARVHGIAIDDIIAKQGSFRESLQEGWLSSEILTETLDKFTGDLDEATLKQKGYTDAQIAEIQKLGQTANDAATKVKTFTQLVDTLKEAAQSGWTQSWQLILGDFEEAKELWTSISDEVSGILNSTSDARNKMLSEWKDLGGRTDLLEGLKQGWIGIKTVLGEVTKAFRDVFPPMTGKQLADLTKKFSTFMKEGVGKLTENGTLDKISRTFKGLFSIFKIGTTVVQGIAKVFSSLLSSIFPVGGDLLSVTAAIGDFFTSVNDGLQKSQGLQDLFSGLAAAASALGSVLKRITSGVGGFFSNLTSGSSLDGLANGVSRAADVLGNAGNLLHTAVEKIKNAIKSLVGAFEKADTSNAGAGFMDFISNAVSTGAVAAFTLLLTRLSNVIKGFSLDNLKDAFTGGGSLIGNIKNVLSESSNALNAFTKSMQTEALRNIAISIGILSASLLVLSFIEPDRIVSSMAAMAGLFIELGAAMKVFMSTFDDASLASSIKATAAMTGIGITMTALAAAITTLAVALKLLSTIPLTNMMTSLAGLAVTIGLLVGAVKVFETVKNFDHIANQIMKLSLALVVMAAALKLLSTIDIKEMGTALLGLAGSMGVLVAGMAVLDRLKLDKEIPSLIALASALTILAVALKIMATMNLKEMGTALFGLAGSMLILVVAMKAMDGLNLNKTAATLIAAAVALNLLGVALKIISSMSLKELGSGLLGMAGSLAILAVGLNAMNGTASGAAALLLAAAALNVLVPALAMLGQMEPMTIVTALIALAGAFAIVAVAGMALNAAVPGLVAFAAAMAAIGIAAVGIGMALTALGVALAALAAGGQAAVALIVYAIQELILLIPEIGAKLAEMFVSFMTTMAENSGPMLEAFVALLTTLLNAVIEIIPQLRAAFTVLLDNGLAVLEESIPKFVTTGLHILIGLLNGIANNIGQVITSATNVVIAFVNGIASNSVRIVNAGMEALVKFLNGVATAISTHSGELQDAGFRIIRAIVQGFTSGVGRLGGMIWNAAKSIASKAYDAIASFFGIASPSKLMKKVGGYVMEGFAIGIDNSGGAVIDSLEENMDEMLAVLSEYEKELAGAFDNLDSEPVITPVLDLTDVSLGMTDLNSLVTADRGLALAANINRNQNGDNLSNSQQDIGTNITFNQYNTSPRALDRIEIYRQTRTQLASLRRI